MSHVIIVMSSSKSNAGQLQNVKEPKNVKVLILSESKTSIKEFYFIKSYINLIKVDLSYNKLTSFPPGFTFNCFHSLRTLFLHYNKFSLIKNLSPILPCRTIIYITLFGNPLQQAKTRHFVVNQMPSLMLMDNKLVKLQERDQIVNKIYIEADPVPFPLVRYQNQEDNEQYLQNMMRQLRIVRQKYVEVNPIIRIQRWWRHLYRIKHRKWKITKLPEKTVKASTVYDLKHFKQNLDRLATEKMEVNKSNKDKIKKLLEGNCQFWKFIGALMRGGVYFTREYCRLNCIQYSQVEGLRVFRHIRTVNQSKTTKSRLLFLLSWHSHIVARLTHNKHTKNRAVHANTTLNKTIVNVQQCLAQQNPNASKFSNLQQKYNCLVQPLLRQGQIIQIIKKQYFKSIGLQLQGIVDQPFPIVFKQLFQRSLAAVTVQRYWKGYKARKSVNASSSIRAAKAAVKIQKWVRNLRFVHRFKFLLEVGIYLKKQRFSSQIVLDMSQMAAIEWYCALKEKGKNFVIPFQQCDFSIEKTTHSNHLNVCKNKIVFNSERKPYPNYLKLNFSNQKRNAELHKTNVLDILFKEAKTIKTIIDSKGVKNLQITYHSIQETLDRKFILALKTYRMQNHQFLTSTSLPSGQIRTATDWLQTLSKNKMVSIQPDSLVLDKRQVEAKTLVNHRSNQSLVSDVELSDGSVYLRVKFYLATLNYSCYLAIKSPTFDRQICGSQSNVSVNKEYYLGRKKSHSRRYDDSSNQNFSRISRNIISLDQALGANMNKKKVLAYPKILSTDQSHTILGSIITPQNSLQKLECEHKFQTYDKFNGEVYPPASQVVRQSLRYKKQLDEIEDLRYKKSIIDEIKESHRQKIRDILKKKSENLSSLRGKLNKQEEQNAEMMKKARLELEQRKSKKHQLIKEMKANSGKFQLQFMKKGIKTVNRDTRQAQKKFASFRERKRDLINHIPEKPINSLPQNTSVKEFSIKITDGDMSLKASDNGKMKSENERDHNYRRIITSENYSPSIRLKSDSCEVLSIEEEQKQKQNAQALKLQRELKRARKKRLVHSVFPEEFYPLKQSNQIGFELPKIIKK